MALENAFQPEPYSSQDAPLFNGANHIMRAGRLETAGGAQHGGDGHLVKADGQNEYFFENAIH